MRSRRDAEHAVALLALVDMLLTELPGAVVKIDGQVVDEDGARSLVRRGVEGVFSGKIGDA